MKYLIVLNRFDLDLNVLKKKLKADNIKQDVKDRVIVDSALRLDDILELQEVKEVYKLYCDWRAFSSFNELASIALKAYKGDKKYKVVAKFLDKMSFSAKEVGKRINTFFKKEGYNYSEDGDVLYIEFKNGFYRIGFNESVKTLNVASYDLSNVVVVLENPSNVLEVEDMFRLCWIFRIPLVILKGDAKLIKIAQEDTKGIEWDKFELLTAIPKGYLKVGFSKHAAKNEDDLVQFFKVKRKIALIFGNDKYGLTQELRDGLDECFRLTPSIKKPLRASHALTYILGINYVVRNL